MSRYVLLSSRKNDPNIGYGCVQETRKRFHGTEYPDQVSHLSKPKMSQFAAAEADIPVYTESGTLECWVGDAHARDLIAKHMATVVRSKGQVRRLVLIASEDSAMTPSARRQAAASYVGGMKTTYRETLQGTSHSVAPIVMTKRIGESGSMATWDPKLTFDDLRRGRKRHARERVA